MQRVAKFEKVSFEQFKKDWTDTFYVTDGIDIRRYKASEKSNGRLGRL